MRPSPRHGKATFPHAKVGLRFRISASMETRREVFVALAAALRIRSDMARAVTGVRIGDRYPDLAGTPDDFLALDGDVEVES
jgi:hypothetical protein